MERCVIYYSWWLLCVVKHAMIVTEYMENGALDRYLRVSPQHTVFTNATISVSIATKKLLKTQERAQSLILFLFCFLSYYNNCFVSYTRTMMVRFLPSSWWACCVASLQAWSTSLTWATSTETWPPATSSSTTTWSAKCLTSACPGCWRTILRGRTPQVWVDVGLPESFSPARIILPRFKDLFLTVF